MARGSRIVCDAHPLELVVEKHLCEAVWANGGVERKIVYPNRRGCTDRLVGFPSNRLFLVETKRKGGRISAHQEENERAWAQVGVQVVYLWSIEEVNAWIRKVRA
jgi:hypothetical protein